MKLAVTDEQPIVVVDERKMYGSTVRFNRPPAVVAAAVFGTAWRLHRQRGLTKVTPR